MIALLLAAALGAAPVGGHDNPGNLPACSNRTVNAVVKRVGCTLGDARCWAQGGGFCMDHVERKLARRGAAARPRLATIRPEEIRPGDVALFAARAHVAYVERVARDGTGRPISVDLSEYNYGTCWVDAELMVTDRYRLEGRRRAVPLAQVDGGFRRALAAGP